MATGKKDGIATLLGGPAPKGDGYAEGKGGSSDDELKIAADDVFDALTKGDRAAFASALHSYVQLCDQGEM